MYDLFWTVAAPAAAAAADKIIHVIQRTAAVEWSETTRERANGRAEQVVG